MKNIVQNAWRQIEKAFESGLLIADEFEHALLLDELARHDQAQLDRNEYEYVTEQAA